MDAVISTPSFCWFSLRELLIDVICKKIKEKGHGFSSSQMLHWFHSYISFPMSTIVTDIKHLYPAGFTGSWTKVSCWQSAEPCRHYSTPDHSGSRRKKHLNILSAFPHLQEYIMKISNIPAIKKFLEPSSEKQPLPDDTYVKTMYSNCKWALPPETAYVRSSLNWSQAAMTQLCCGAVYIVPKLVFHILISLLETLTLFCPVSDCYRTSSENLCGEAGI